MIGKGLWIAAAIGLALVRVEDAHACSCMGAQDVLVPGAATDAPLNAHARLEVAPRRGSVSATQSVLRVHGGADVETTARTFPDGSLTFVDLRPKKPLQPGTLYEIATVDPSVFPSTTVLGAFTTGTAPDATAPKIDAIAGAIAKGNVNANGGSCSIHGPWVEVGPIKASDPGRPAAKLLFAVWTADASGNIDTSKPPTALLQPYNDVVALGRTSLCDPRDFTLPTTPTMSFAIAAVDEAGNTSATRTLKVDLKNVRAAHP